MSGGASSALPRLQDVLQLRPVVEGQPEVVVGGQLLDRAVRWAHVAEAPDVGVMLSGGEVVLTTGLLITTEAAQTSFVQRLADSGVVGVVLGMGRAFDAIPASLVAACRHRDLALITLWRPAAFVAITEAVQTLCLQRAAARVMLADAVRARLGQLTLERAAMQALVTELSALAKCPVVVESLDRRVMLSAGDSGLGEVLRDWGRLSQFISRSAGSALVHATADGIVAARLMRGTTAWGRLILFAHSVPTDRALVIAERGAEALSLHWLTSSHVGDWEQEAAAQLFADLLSPAHGSDVLALRARAAGFSIRNATITPLILGVARTETGEPGTTQLSPDRVRTAARWAGVAALIGPPQGPDQLTVLCSVSSTTNAVDAVDAFGRQLRADTGDAITCIAAGFPATSLHALPRSLLEARRVFASRDARAPVLRLGDLHLDGLVHMLADDERMQAFVDRELGPLLDYPALLELLESFIEHDLNKAETAKAMFLSRPAVYRRLDRIGELLATDLSSVSRIATLHVALRAWRARATVPGSRTPGS